MITIPTKCPEQLEEIKKGHVTQLSHNPNWIGKINENQWSNWQLVSRQIKQIGSQCKCMIGMMMSCKNYYEFPFWIYCNQWGMYLLFMFLLRTPCLILLVYSTDQKNILLVYSILGHCLLWKVNGHDFNYLPNLPSIQEVYTHFFLDFIWVQIKEGNIGNLVLCEKQCIRWCPLQMLDI